jgi:hypothetical protein
MSIAPRASTFAALECEGKVIETERKIRAELRQLSVAEQTNYFQAVADFIARTPMESVALGIQLESATTDDPFMTRNNKIGVIKNYTHKLCMGR